DVHPVVLGDRLQLAEIRLDHRLDRELAGQPAGMLEGTVGHFPAVAVGERQHGEQAHVAVAAGECREQVRVRLVLGGDRPPAPIDPAAQAVEVVAGPDQPEPDRRRGVVEAEVGGAVGTDAEAGVDVALAAAELQLGFVEDLDAHQSFLRLLRPAVPDDRLAGRLRAAAAVRAGDAAGSVASASSDNRSSWSTPARWSAASTSAAALPSGPSSSALVVGAGPHHASSMPRSTSKVNKLPNPSM